MKKADRKKTERNINLKATFGLVMAFVVYFTMHRFDRHPVLLGMWVIIGILFALTGIIPFAILAAKTFKQ